MATATPQTNTQTFELLIALACVAAGTFMIQRSWRLPQSEWSGNAGGAPVGSLRWEKGGVRFRGEGSLAWRDLPELDKITVSRGDTIFTGEDGVAELALKDGTTAQLQPNTLIVIEVPPESRGTNAPPVLKIESGGVEIKFALGATKTKIVSRGREITIEPTRTKASRVSLKVDPKSSLQITPTEGSISVASANSAPIAVEHGQAVEVQADEAPKAVELSATQLQPVSGGTLVLLPHAPVRFEWETRGTASDLILKVDDQKFEIAAGRSTAEVALPAGNHQWQLAKPSGESLSSRRSFRIRIVEIPKLLGPVDSAKIQNAHDEPQAMTLSWEKPDESDRVAVEWGLQGNDGSLSRIETPDTAFSLSTGAGSYRWRAQNVVSGVKSDWTPWRSFQVIAAPKPAAVQPVIEEAVPSVAIAPIPEATPSPIAVVPPVTPMVTKEPEVVAKPVPPKVKILKPVEATPIAKSLAAPSLKPIITTTRLGEFVTPSHLTIPLRWAPVANATEYFVQVLTLKNTSFKTLTVKEPKFDLVLADSRYSTLAYRVTARGPGLPEGRSKAYAIKIEWVAPEIVIPDDQSLFVENASLHLIWTKTALAKAYAVEISRTADFGSTIEDETTPNNLFTFRPSDPGTYFWRVQGVYVNKRSPWSKIRSFIIK